MFIISGVNALRLGARGAGILLRLVLQPRPAWPGRLPAWYCLSHTRSLSLSLSLPLSLSSLSLSLAFSLGLAGAGRHHTVDHDPLIKSQLASTQLILAPHMAQIWSRLPPNKGVPKLLLLLFFMTLKPRIE